MICLKRSITETTFGWRIFYSQVWSSKSQHPFSIIRDLGNFDQILNIFAGILPFLGNVTLTGLTWYIQDALPFIILNYPLAVLTLGQSPIAIVTKGLKSSTKEAYTERFFSSKYCSFYYSISMITILIVILIALKHYKPWKIIQNKLGI